MILKLLRRFASWLIKLFYGYTKFAVMCDYNIYKEFDVYEDAMDYFAESCETFEHSVKLVAISKYKPDKTLVSITW